MTLKRTKKEPLGNRLGIFLVGRNEIQEEKNTCVCFGDETTCA